MIERSTDPATGTLWAKVIDHTRCIGCHACTTACKSENEVPLSVTRTYVKYVDVGRYPEARRAFQVTRCNQCEQAPCVEACPTAAMFKRPDGIVDFDKSVCIGCKACIAACPYDAIFINPEDHSAEKCNFCAHRLDIGLEPACVVVCPTQAILVGDLNDPESLVAQRVQREAVTVRRPEKGTRPKLFYQGAHAATLDPLAARRPEGGLFLWSEQGDVEHGVPSGHPGPWNSSAAALLSYDVPHRAPWDHRVSLYTWTKSVAAGLYLAAVGLGLADALPWSGAGWRLVVPILALVFLAATGGILIWDLEHPKRFLLIFRRPQWRSWLVRGGLILTAYGGWLVVHLATARSGAPPGWVAPVGAALAAATAVYTAFLFAQARARDLWQSPLLPPHLLVQALVAGAGSLALLAPWLGGGAEALTLFAAASVAHGLMILGEAAIEHPTEHAALARRAMVRGRFARWFWGGVGLTTVGAAAPFAPTWLAPVAVVAGMIGLLLYEHAYVQAGQSVPLA